jgi:hypothetical protein
MSDTLTKREVAHQARLFAQGAGITEGHGKRGRVSANVVFQFLQSKPAKSVREIAEQLGVEITPTGKISEAEYVAITDYVTKNAPKATEDSE